jgi:hypothetical protein
MLYKAIILILSSNESYYNELRELQRIYLKNYLPLIKFFFIEFKEDMMEHVREENDYIYVKGIECISPGMIVKTIVAMKYINDRYKYEFLVRTNLSTLFVMPNLFEYLSIVPTENMCGGFGFRSFITGTGIIVSQDVTIQIIENVVKYDLKKHNEDIIISSILNLLKTPYFNCNKFYKWGFFIDQPAEDNSAYYYFSTNGEYNEDFDIPNNILHFRIKSANREIDIKYFKLLLKKIYNVCQCD